MTAGAVSSAPAGEAGCRLPADQLPDLVSLAVDLEARPPLTDPTERSGT